MPKPLGIGTTIKLFLANLKWRRLNPASPSVKLTVKKERSARGGEVKHE